MSTLGDAADVSPAIKFLPHTLHVCGRNLITGLTSAASPRVDISSTSKVGQKLGVSLPLLICSPLAWPSRLQYRRGRKSRRDLWITLYIKTERNSYSVQLQNNQPNLMKGRTWLPREWSAQEVTVGRGLLSSQKALSRFIGPSQKRQKEWY